MEAKLTVHEPLVVGIMESGRGKPIWTWEDVNAAPGSG
ncbi:unnamed protein product [Dibothriocephalus latus]|uniref:Uncharacterized protein n=1 Tax=Dibothriocephalus latus TaxID=60516 RepID=A0A3P7P1J7_DIBLA|nr:unnamed protein product [Dibothriocephalus latus]